MINCVQRKQNRKRRKRTLTLDFRESNFKKTLYIPLIDYMSLGRNLTRSQKNNR
ncbi:hypothetical protein WN48_02604 [Eufriesea mexicana]|uniref:Uncharacterized protein n=1 Tax=Eufriesea mexicana TaxID=516756 RepID=A0A310SD51_9HYME|nr:hypothetical protein WN48_02604 [Eufriesea mexicana]